MKDKPLQKQQINFIIQSVWGKKKQGVGKMYGNSIKYWNKDLQVAECSDWVNFNGMNVPAEGFADEKTKSLNLSLKCDSGPTCGAPNLFTAHPHNFKTTQDFSKYV